MSFCRAGRLLAISRSSHNVQWIDMAKIQEIATLAPSDPELIDSLTFSPDGSRLAVGTDNHVIQLWDLRAIRKSLAALGLDWDLPPYPPERSDRASVPVGVTVVPAQQVAESAE